MSVSYDEQIQIYNDNARKRPPLNDALGTRMKENYESVTKYRLVRRMPVAIRLDGCHFHTFTRGFDKPFDEIFMRSMQKTMQYLCEHIQNCVLGYTQSDEITLILTDYKKLTSDAWFDDRVQKMSSVSASICTMAFNKIFRQEIETEFRKTPVHYSHLTRLRDASDKGAYFDSRVFNIPREEVTNLVYWRQLDAIRNSVLSLAQSKMSQKEMQNKSCNELKKILLSDYNTCWESLPADKQRGACCIHQDGNWIIDTDIPVFRNEGRDYIERFLNPAES